jgi:nucleotide-binding universal stress UspA family protein
MGASGEQETVPDTVLVALDGSPLADRALDYAVETFPTASVTTIYVINPVDAVVDVEAGGLPVAEDWYERASERAEGIHARASESAAARGVDLESVTEVGKPSRRILAYATEHDVDQIVMGSHGRSGVGRALLGSVAERVTRRARVPVTIVS